MVSNKFLVEVIVFGGFFHGCGSGFFQIRSGFLADPDSDSGKKFDPEPEKSPDPKHCLNQQFLHF